MDFPRETYVRKLSERIGNGLIKVITGSRRVGKSFLMNELFYCHLLGSGIDESEILRFAFDSDDDSDILDGYFPEEDTKIMQKDGSYLVNSRKFRAFAKEWAGGRERLFFLLDEVQLLEGFVGTLNGLQRHRGYELYVTGSNSKFLSSDIATEFRGRGTVLHVFPLSFSEYVGGTGLSPESAWKEYVETGGIPLIATMKSREERRGYLQTLCEETYLKDVVSRNHVRNAAALSDVFDVSASMIGSMINPRKISDTFRTALGKSIADDTVSEYIGYLEDAFLISRARRFDVKGRKYIGTPYKLYFEDIGVRNARLNFRQMEETHLMENILYNDLRYRGFNVDVGVVRKYEKTDRIDVNGHPIYATKSLEVDFVATSGDRKYYIQSALSLDPDKEAREKRSLVSIDDSFVKIVVTKNGLNILRDEKGIITMDLFDFLLNPDVLGH
ncbi:MAG: ATP-binding protein [Candidatus Methanomethylophilaceae archaeon]|nr:ATP-binding protein [Candidatus Methanomethylophilaceae archaeon]